MAGFYFCLLRFAICLLTWPFPHREEQVKRQIAKGKAAEMNEQCGNVIENKGSTSKDRQRTGEYHGKQTYLRLRCGNVTAKKGRYSVGEAVGGEMTSREVRRGQSRPQRVKAETFRPLPETPLRGRLLNPPQGRAKCAGHVRIEERSNVDLRVSVRQDVTSQSNVGRTLWPNMMVVLVKMGSHSNVTQRAEL